jgi:uncharacterized protein
MKNVVILAGEGEYESDVTMRAVADRIAAQGDVHIDYQTPDVLEDQPEFPTSSFGELTGLADADLLVMYTRFRVLPDEETAAIAEYLERGGSILGLRTSSHAFHPVEGSPWFEWTTNFAQNVFGSGWTRHHGHTSTTDVTAVATHPILDGVPSAFHVDSWLYVSNPPAGATVLLWGVPVAPESEPAPSPVAWVRELGEQRVFYTSLGGQTDLQREEVLTLLGNAAAWCLRQSPESA